MSASRSGCGAYHAADEDAAIELWRRTWQLAYPHLDFAARLDWWRERWRNELVPTATITLAEIGRTAGRLRHRRSDDRSISIRSWSRRRPGARGSRDALLAEAKRLSPAGLDLMVNADNARAIRFYEKQGFAVTGDRRQPALRRADPQDGVAALTCRRRRLVAPELSMTAVSRPFPTAASMAHRIDAVLIETFAALDLPVELARSTVSDRPDLADRQCNGAMAAARKLGRNPREIAGAITAALASRPEFSQVSLAGPGFVNMRLSAAFLAEVAQAQGEDPDLGLAKAATPERIVVDFGGPNVAKPLHVGHLRSLVIGESLRRMLAACGHQVVSDVHLGDWGLQMGQLISELEIRQPRLPYFDAACTGPFPDVPPVTLADLEEMYPAAAKACQADPVRLDAARAATAELQAGRPGYRALWRAFRDLSLAALQRDFEELGAHFDLLGGESDAAPLIAPLISELTANGVATESDGAIIVAVAEPNDRQPMPPLILAKADGAALYATTDLATLADRVARLRANRILYVVDQRQALHFEQVFRAARKSGLAAILPAGPCRLRHRQRPGRPGAQDPRRRDREACGPAGRSRDDGGATDRDARPGRRPAASRAHRAGAEDRHRGGEVRRPVEQPHVRLRVRPRAPGVVRRQDRTVSAIRLRADRIDPGEGCRSAAKRSDRSRSRIRRSGRWRSNACAFRKSSPRRRRR